MDERTHRIKRDIVAGIVGHNSLNLFNEVNYLDGKMHLTLLFKYQRGCGIPIGTDGIRVTSTVACG